MAKSKQGESPIQAKPDATPKAGGVFTTSAFRDRYDWNTEYTAGQDISHLPEARLSQLIASGHAVKQEADK